MNCGIPYCHGTGAGPRRARRAARSTTRFRISTIWSYGGNWEEASRNLHSTNNFPDSPAASARHRAKPSCTLNINDNPGHHQDHRMRDCRSRLGQWLAQAGDRCNQDRQESRGWSAPARRHGLRAAGSRVPATRCICSRNTPRPVACCAMAFPISRWRNTSSTAAWRRWKLKASRSTTARRVGGTSPQCGRSPQDARRI